MRRVLALVVLVPLLVLLFGPAAQAALPPQVTGSFDLSCDTTASYYGVVPVWLADINVDAGQPGWSWTETESPFANDTTHHVYLELWPSGTFADPAGDASSLQALCDSWWNGSAIDYFASNANGGGSRPQLAEAQGSYQVAVWSPLAPDVASLATWRDTNLSNLLAPYDAGASASPSPSASGPAPEPADPVGGIATSTVALDGRQFALITGALLLLLLLISALFMAQLRRP